MLTWLIIDWQPGFIFDGPMAGSGYAQTAIRLLREKMPNYRHEDQEVVNVRIYDILKSKDACFAAAPYQGIDLTDERRRGVIFSAPTFLFFYHGLIARKESKAQLTRYMQDGAVDFQALISGTSLTGAFQPGRTYSRWLNQIFETHPGVDNMFRWSGKLGLTQNMFKMLEAERFDYFVDYSMLLKFHELSKGHMDEFDFYPLLEHQGQFGLGGIACRDSAVGRQAIADINKALATIRTTPEFQDANSRWLMPDGQQEQYWHLWRTEVLSRAK